MARALHYLHLFNELKQPIYNLGFSIRCQVKDKDVNGFCLGLLL